MKLSTEGRDELGAFEVIAPGHCAVCSLPQDIVVIYNPISLKRGLGDIDPSYTIIAEAGKKIKNIGVTCGCYAKFHRQVAHIRGRRQTKRRK